MRQAIRLAAAAATALLFMASAEAQTTNPQASEGADGVIPGVITDGSGNVSVGGQPAARAGDRTDRSGSIVQGSSNVFINGRPAVTLGDTTSCGGVVVGGGSGVFINGKPVARAGDTTTCCAGR